MPGDFATNKLKQQILVDFSYLGEYLDLMNRSIPRIAELEKERRLIHIKLFNKNIEIKDEDEIGISNLITGKYINKYIYESFIIILWSFFEDAIKSLSNDESLLPILIWPELKLKDLKGDLLERAEKLWLRGFINDEQSKSIRLIRRVRNVIVHENSTATDEEVKKILNQTENIGKIHLIDGEIRVDEEFCRWSHELLGEIIYSVVLS